MNLERGHICLKDGAATPTAGARRAVFSYLHKALSVLASALELERPQILEC